MNVVTTFRIPGSAIARIDTIYKRLASDDKIRVLTTITRSVAIRLAILHGIEDMQGRCIGIGERLKPGDSQVTFSIPLWLLDRAQAIASKDPSGITKRTHILRIALARGAEILQEEA